MSATEHTIRYAYGSYSGTETVILLSDDDRDPRDVMWSRFEREGYLTLGMASRTARVVSSRRVPSEDDPSDD